MVLEFPCFSVLQKRLVSCDAPTETKAEPRAWVKHTVQKRRVLWAGDVVEGNPSVSPVYRVHHCGGATQGSQLLIVHIRKELEGTPGKVVGHRARVLQTRREPFQGATREKIAVGEKGRRWTRGGSNVQGLISVSSSTELDHESFRAGSLGEANELAVHPECWLVNI